MAKKIKWGTTTVPHHKLYISKLTSAEFYALDLIARKQVYSIKRGGNGYFETNQAKIAQVLFLSKGTVSDLFKKMKERKLLEESEHGFRVVDSFIEFFYIMKNDELQVDDEVNYTHTLEGLVALNRERKSSEIELLEEGEKFGNRTKSSKIEHLHHNSINNKTDVRQKAEDKSVFENENQAPQVKAKILEEDDVPRHIKENNICSDGLNEYEYPKALESWLSKWLRKYTKDKAELAYHLTNAWEKGFKFNNSKGSVNGGEKFFANSKRFYEENKTNAPDHSEIEDLVEKTINWCNENWKDQWRTYPALMAIRKSYDKERAAIKKLLVRNKKREVSLIMYAYSREPTVMNQRMDSDWASVAGNFKNVLELAEALYNERKSWVIPGWPKQQS